MPVDRAGDGTIDHEDADQDAAAHQRHDHVAAHAAQLHHPATVVGNPRVGFGVVDDRRLPREQRDGPEIARNRPRVEAPERRLARRIGRAVGNQVEHVTLHPRDMAGSAVDQAQRGGDDGVEHRARIRRRLADHAQDLGRRGLPFQRLLGLAEHPCILDRDHRLVGEGLEQRDLLVRERHGRKARHGQRANAALLPHQGRVQRGVVSNRRSALAQTLRHAGAVLHVGVIENLALVDRVAVDRLARRPRVHVLNPARRLARPFIGMVEGVGFLMDVDHAVVAEQPQGDDAVVEQLPATAHDLLEHRCRVRHRAADHLQHLGSRGLVFQCLLGLVEQAHVLDRDHRLVGKGADQFDLPGLERPDLCAPHADDAEHDAVAQQGCHEHSPVSGAPAHARAVGKLVRSRQDVVDMHLAGFNRTAPRAPIATDPLCIAHGHGGADVAVVHAVTKMIALLEQHDDVLRLAQPPRARGHGLQDRLHVVRRTCDDIKDLRCRRLALQPLLGLAEHPRVLDRDRRLVGESLEEAEFLGTEGHVRLARDRDEADALALPQHGGHHNREID